MFLKGGRFRNRQLLSPVTIQVMTSPQTKGIPPRVAGDFEGSEHGRTWAIPAPPHKDYIVRGGFGHGGLDGCRLFVSPEWELCVAFVTAKSGWNAVPVINAIFGCVR